GGRGAGESRTKGSASGGVLVKVGRSVRESGGGASAPDDRRAWLLLSDLPIALYGSRESARRAPRVQRRSACPDRGYLRAVAARHAIFGVGRSRIYCAIRGSGAQRSR